VIAARLCFALALWNGKDPILKERMYGLTNSEANHGEDVKEYYFYLDSTPTHSLEGGFLGLDNIGVFDRSSPLPTGGYLEQVDGTAWLALYAQNMIEIAIELAAHRPAYEELASNFATQFVLIGHAMNRVGPGGMWDEEDGFYYDVLRLPDGNSGRLRVRSMVGLLPLCATTVVEKWQRERISRLTANLYERYRRMPELRESVHAIGPGHFGVAERGILALVNEDRLRRIPVANAR
jgi:hypothetical protein